MQRVIQSSGISRLYKVCKMSEEERNISSSELEEEQPRFEESIWAEIIFKASDISCLAKWPLLILAIILVRITVV